MAEIRKIIALGLAIRSQAGLKVRQPLAKAEIKSKIFSKEMMNLMAEELNVKQVAVNPKIKENIKLDTKITAALKEEGLIRDLIRQIQGMRKDGQLKPQNKIYLRYSTSQAGHKIIEQWQKDIQKEVRADTIESGSNKKERFLVTKEIDMNGQKLWLGIKKI